MLIGGEDSSGACSASCARTGAASSLSFVLAGVAMGVSVLIPYLVGRTVDEIRDGGDEPLAAGARRGRPPGVLRLVFSVARRLVAGRVSLGVEYDLRNRMYEHLQSLELAFFDRSRPAS